MFEQDEIKKIFRESVEVDEEGMKKTRTVKIEDIIKSGVDDVGAFVQGVMDAENEEDFRESSSDYVKGYRYGKTGTF